MQSLKLTPTKQVEHNFHPHYRPDIDGLRALAILPVVGFHAFPGWIPGGFVGVDVFFVISGYLISAIIFKSLADNDFSFIEFYAHRIRRIFPALIVVMLTCFVFGWFALLPDEFKQLGKHMAGGAGFVQNFVLWREAGYFDADSELKPLMHLWSLAIEEQFYLVFPLACWLCWRWGWNLVILVMVVGLLSFAANMKGIDHDAVKTFFAPQTRFWELMAGALLAGLTLKHRRWGADKGGGGGAVSIIPPASRKYLLWAKRALIGRWLYRAPADKAAQDALLDSLLSFIGLGLILLAVFALDKTQPYPGGRALFPVAGSVLLIAAGPKAWVNRRLLSNRLAVGIGLISYPLYLWHWPLLSFVRIVNSGTPDRVGRIVIVAMSFVFAALTWRLVEKPIRYSKSRRGGKTVALCIVMILVGLIGWNGFAGNVLPSNAINYSHAIADSQYDGGYNDNIEPGCGIKLNNDEIQKIIAHCAKDKRGNIKYVLMGDSKATSLAYGVVRTSSSTARWEIIGGHKIGLAPPVPMLDADPDPDRPAVNSALEAIITDPQIKAVAFAFSIRTLLQIDHGAPYDDGYLRQVNTSTRFETAFNEVERAINKVVANNKKVVFVVDNPALPNSQDCIGRYIHIDLKLFSLSYGKANNPNCSKSRTEFIAQIKRYRELLERVRALHPDSVYIFDPTDIYCPPETGRCNAIQNGRLMTAITDHISDYASGLVGKKLNAYMNTLTTEPER